MVPLNGTSKEIHLILRIQSLKDKVRELVLTGLGIFFYWIDKAVFDKIDH